MKRKGVLLALVFIFLTLSSLMAVEEVRANPYSPPLKVVWNIQCPLNNSTYFTRDLTLNFTVATNSGDEFYYSVDTQQKNLINVSLISKEVDEEYYFLTIPITSYLYTYQGTVMLTNLRNGEHTLDIYQMGTVPQTKYSPQHDYVISQTSVEFSIASNTIPLSVLISASVLVAVAFVAVIAGLLVYFKRKTRDRNK
jgi:hypothetical protein